MNSGQQPHSPAHGLGGAAGAATTAAGKALLTPYVLEPPEWRAPLIANKTPPLYPDFFPGSTALYPQSAAQSGAHVPGVSRDSSQAGTAGSQFTPIAGVTASKEDELSETVAKLGFVNKAVVQTENFSAHALIYNKLHNGPSIHALAKIVQRVLEQQASDSALLPNPGPWTYKPPTKVVYNASRLETWYAELANPSVPLTKLAKTIPSAPSSSSLSITSSGTGIYTGSSSASPAPAVGTGKSSGNAMDKNLDMLITRQVPLDRALWFLQAVGQNDISQLSKSKNLQTHPILSYSADFTVALVENLKRQVSEALLPLTQTTGPGRLLPGMSLKGRPRNVLGEENNKDRWMAKWNYTLQLLNVCLEESMLDKQRLCSLLLQNLQMNPTRVTILWWTSIILQTIFDDILDTAWMSKTLIIAVYDWLESFRNGKEEDAEDPLRHACEEVGQGILRQIWLTDPEMFLIPELWAEQGARLRLKIYLAVSVAESGDKDRQVWDDLENRVDRLLCRKASSDEPLTALLNSELTSNSLTPPVHNYGKVDEARLVSMLDEWEGEESIPSLTQRLFSDVDTKGINGTHTQIDHRAACSSICKLLLMWATTTTRKRDHRPYLVSSILRCRAGSSPHNTLLKPSSLDQADTDSEAACDPERLLELQTGIMDWMDRQEAYFFTPLSDGAIEWTTRDAVLQMCQILLEQNVIDLSALLQKVIARGVLQAGNSNQGIIYSSLLRNYGDHGSRLALKWQMARISTLSGADVNDGAVSTGEESVKQQIETILAGMSTEASADGDAVARPSMELLVQRFFDLPAMERLSIKESWLVPALARALRRNKSRKMNAQTVLSVLWLLQQLGAKAAQVHLAILVFHECPTNQDLVMNMFAVCQVNMLVLASTWNLSDYAASLSGAYQQVFGGDIAQMQILADLVQMGTRGHLKARQLRALRQYISTAPRPASLPDLLTNVMSPPNADKQSQELLEEATQCLRICMIRHEKGNKTADQFETALANLVSICGPDLSFFGVVLPVMLRLVGTAQEEGRVALAALAATWSASCIPGRSRQAHVPSQQMLPLVLLELRTSFDTRHANFLQLLVSDNTVSLTRLLAEVCEPILRDLTINQWGHAAAASLVQMLAGFLGRPPDHNQSAWRQLAWRQPLYRRSEGFPTLLSVLKEVSNLLQASCNTESVWRTQLADLYQGILREPAYQDCILQHMQHQLLSGTMPSTWREANCLWDTLHFVIESCITSSSNADAELTVHNNPIDPTAIRSILQAGAYSTFVSSMARWYFKVLLLRLDRDADTDDVQPANNRHGQTAFLASQCLQFLLEATQKEHEEHVAMFSEHIGRDLFAAGASALENTLHSYADVLHAMTKGTHRALRAYIRKAARLVLILNRLIRNDVIKHSSSPTGNLSDVLLRAVTASLDALKLVDTIDSSSTPHTALIVKSVLCLALFVKNPSSSASEVEGNVASTLVDGLLQGSMPDFEDETGRDILAWLLQALEQTRRNRILEPVQHLLISAYQSPVPSRARDCAKLLSLGPPPPISFTVYQGMRYMTLQRTWAGVSIPGTGVTKSDTKTSASNNDPFDLLKYQCRTQIVERHIQPQFRREPGAGWQKFDSEVPWHRGTGFQRDFRRATVQQHDLMQQTNSQTQRTRAPLQADGRTSQAKSENINPPAEPVKSVNKEKVNDQATRESASKKRKSVPDVVVADSYSPKKKSKTTNNVGAHALASKQPKKK